MSSLIFFISSKTIPVTSSVCSARNLRGRLKGRLAAHCNIWQVVQTLEVIPSLQKTSQSFNDATKYRLKDEQPPKHGALILVDQSRYRRRETVNHLYRHTH